MLPSFRRLDLLRRARAKRAAALACRSRVSSTRDTDQIALFTRFALELEEQAQRLDQEALALAA